MISRDLGDESIWIDCLTSLLNQKPTHIRWHAQISECHYEIIFLIQFQTSFSVRTAEYISFGGCDRLKVRQTYIEDDLITVWSFNLSEWINVIVNCGRLISCKCQTAIIHYTIIIAAIQHHQCTTHDISSVQVNDDLYFLQSAFHANLLQLARREHYFRCPFLLTRLVWIFQHGTEFSSTGQIWYAVSDTGIWWFWRIMFFPRSVTVRLFGVRFTRKMGTDCYRTISFVRRTVSNRYLYFKCLYFKNRKYWLFLLKQTSIEWPGSSLMLAATFQIRMVRSWTCNNLSHIRT